MKETSTIGVLYLLLQSRPTPEQVAGVLLENLPDLSEEEVQSLRLPLFYRRSLSMIEDFNRPVSEIQIQMDLVPDLLGGPVPELEDLSELIEVFQPIFGERLSKKERKERGIYKNARWYNKRRRLIQTLQRKRTSLRRSEELYLFTRISKSALSVGIPYELFGRDLNTAAFVTYLAARMNRRSMFTNQSQDRAFDQVSQILLDRCRKSPTTQWFVIAHILPDKEVLDRLEEVEKGYLVGRWYTLLEKMAERLKDSWSPEIDRLRMVVQRGNDSSTWNAVAGSWNRAREHWISLVYSLSGQRILEEVCPGKVMRLMAADVVRWHQRGEGDIHPDTKVWANLPFPWEVLKGEERCGLEEIRRECEKAGADFQTWTYREGRETVSFRPTPDLVHGVEVSSPELAKLLRKAGVFSGKSVIGEVPEMDIHRDRFGAALLVSDWSESPWASSTRADGSVYRQDEE